MIKIFTTATCAYCAMVKRFLDMKGKVYEVIALDDNPSLRQELLEKTGAMTVPIVEFNGRYVIGWKPAELTALIA